MHAIKHPPPCQLKDWDIVCQVMGQESRQSENKMQTKCLLYSVSYTDQGGFTIKGELLICFFLTKSVTGQVTPIALRVTHPHRLHLCGSALCLVPVLRWGVAGGTLWIHVYSISGGGRQGDCVRTVARTQASFRKKTNKKRHVTWN